MTRKDTYVVPLALVARKLSLHNRIMKHAYSFLAGVALVSLCVFATRSLPGYMFLLGCLVTAISNILLCRVIGFGRIARFFFWLSKRESVFVSCGPGVAARSDVRNYPSPSLNPVPGQSKEARVADGARSVTRDRRESRRKAGSPQRSTGPMNESPTRCNPSAARNEDNRSVVQSREMLPSVQQDVLSALINLKVPCAHAEEAVHAAAKEHGGESFDTLFRTALNLLNAGKSRRAAA